MSEEFGILLVQEGDSPRTTWELDKPVMVIGRGQDCDIIVNERQVSRHHVRVIRDDDRYKVVDLRSKNGTFLNGVQLSPGEPNYLRDGDQLGVALSSRLVFVDAGATAPVMMDDVGTAEIRMDQEAKRVWVMGQEVQPPLSLAQYKLLSLLYERQGAVVSRDEIVSVVWSGEGADGVSEQAIDALARRLRERIAEIDPDNQYMITVRGHGFRLENYAG